MRHHPFRRALAGSLLPLLLAAPVMAQTWAQRTPTASPSARSASPLVYDASRNASVLFGGFDGSNVARGDTWSWDGASWTQLNPIASPTARWGHGMVYDTRRSVAVLHGGFVPNVGFVQDTWEWNGATWSQRTTSSAPPARGYFGMAYDSIRGRTVLFGGVDNTLGPVGDTWEFDGSNWTQVNTATAPSPRRGPAMAFDSVRNEVVLFGGGVSASSVAQDTWVYNGITWQQRAPATQPPARQESNLSFDALCGKSVLLGGVDGTFATRSGDSWVWDGANWSQIAGAQPSARNFGGMAFDLQRGETVLFGGLGSAPLGDTWIYAGGCNRTMSTLTMPQIGQPASFQYAYPLSASGHFHWQILTSHMIGSLPVSVPGFVTVGQLRANFLEILYEWTGVLDSSGSVVRSVSIPNDPIFAGFAFDVQALDIDLRTNTIWFARNDAEVRIGQAASGSVFTEVLSTGSQQVISASQGVEVSLPAGAMAADNPVVVEVDPTPPAWATDISYAVAPTEVNLGINVDALMTDDEIEIAIPLGNFPLADVDPVGSPGLLNGSIFMYVAPGVGIALPTRVETVSPANGIGSFRRAVARVGRRLANVIRTAATTTVNVATRIVNGIPVIGPVIVRVVTLVVRTLNCLISGAPTQLSLQQWDDIADDWAPYVAPTATTNRVAIVVHGIQLFSPSRSAGPITVAPLGRSLSAVSMPFSAQRLYSKVYCVSYQDSAGVEAVGNSLRGLVSGISATEIDFVCFSMGGLVTRWASELNSSPAWNSATGKISRIVTLGTPHEGTPAAALQSMFMNFGPLSPLQRCYGQHLTDLGSLSSVVRRLASSPGSGPQTRYYAFAGTRHDNYNGQSGNFVNGLLLGSESDGIVPRYSALSNSLASKGDLRVRETAYLNHSELVSDPTFFSAQVMPRLIEDRPGAVPVVQFTAIPPAGLAPLAVAFSNSSTSGATAWRWDFNNDGIVDSTARNPSFVYSLPGTYTVRLEADYASRPGYAGGTVSQVRTDYIVAHNIQPNHALNMVPIQHGTFQMGSVVVGGTAVPVHAVTITRPFWVGKYEVTQSEYLSLMGTNPSYHQGPTRPDAAQRPVERVTWSDAMAYCTALNLVETAAGRVPPGYQYRLPTEAEWEYCCRAGTTTDFWTGATILCSQANFGLNLSAGGNCSLGQTVIVGSYAPNPWGVCDSHGNVLEWCLDSWNGTANYPTSAVSDPYVAIGSARVLRGGAFSDVSPACRSSVRLSSSVTMPTWGIGFRMVLAPVLVP